MNQVSKMLASSSLGFLLAALPTSWSRAADAVKEPTTQPAAASQSPLSFTMKDIDGKDVNLADYRGKVVMLINVASKCGNTPQYTALEKMYEDYKDKGFVIIGFPANDFHGQEPGTDAEIKAFCTGKYNVTFPIMSKITVKGAEKAPVYKFLTEPATAGDFSGEIAWNFAKFLVDRNGNIIARFSPKTLPTDPKLVGAVEKAIAVPAPTAISAAG